MRKYLLFIIVITQLMIISCEPKPSGEGINLPPIAIGLKVSPDTAYIKLGDTVYLTASVSSTLSNGVKLEDGKAIVDLFIGYINQTPITTFAFDAALPNEHLLIFEDSGGVNISNETGKVTHIYALPYGDSLQVALAFVPLKKGTYGFQIQSMFYEGSKGKTRTQPYFINENHHFDELWRIPGNSYYPGEQGYDSRYYFAVTD